MRTNTAILSSLSLSLTLVLAACGAAPPAESSTEQDVIRAPAGDPCGGVSASGLCSGTVLKWCNAGRLFESDCAYDVETTCMYVEGEAKCVMRGDVGAACRSFRDCRQDLECPPATGQGPQTCQCLQGVCKDRYPEAPSEPNPEGRALGEACIEDWECKIELVCLGNTCQY